MRSMVIGCQILWHWLWKHNFRVTGCIVWFRKKNAMLTAKRILNRKIVSSWFECVRKTNNSAMDGLWSKAIDVQTWASSNIREYIINSIWKDSCLWFLKTVWSKSAHDTETTTDLSVWNMTAHGDRKSRCEKVQVFAIPRARKLWSPQGRLWRTEIYDFQCKILRIFSKFVSVQVTAQKVVWYWMPTFRNTCCKGQLLNPFFILINHSTVVDG